MVDTSEEGEQYFYASDQNESDQTQYTDDQL
jgi:hypothetical protein